MRFSTIATAIAAPLLASASPLAATTTAAVCKPASSVLSALHALTTLDKFCTSYLSITPSTITFTSTTTSPLTYIVGNIVLSTASPAPPGTTTLDANPVTKNGKGTVTVTSTLFTVRTVRATETSTTTVGKVCATTQVAVDTAVQTACSCLGITTPTVTSTEIVTKTGALVTVTQDQTQIYDATTTYAPIATVTERTSVSTIYSTYKTTTSTSTFYNTVYEYKTATKTATSCTATTTVQR